MCIRDRYYTVLSGRVCVCVCTRMCACMRKTGERENANYQIFVQCFTNFIVITLWLDLNRANTEFFPRLSYKRNPYK